MPKYSRVGQKRLDDSLEHALALYMQGALIPQQTILSILQECTGHNSAVHARRLHSLAIDIGVDPASWFVDHLIRCFTDCGSLLEVNQVFRKASMRTTYTWNVIIAAHLHFEEELRSLELLVQMEEDGVRPDRVTFLYMLKACSFTKCIERGRLLHRRITKSNLQSDKVLMNALVDMYGKCGSMEEAADIFSSMQCRDVVSYSTMMAGYANLGKGLHAFELYEEMLQAGIEPNLVSFLAVLKACSTTTACDLGMVVHAHMIEGDCALILVVLNALLDMYAKCERLEEALRIFDSLANPSLVSWASLISAYAQLGCPATAVELFEKMQQSGTKPDKVTYLSVLRACGALGDAARAKNTHVYLMMSGFMSDVIVCNTVIDMYVKCGCFQEATKVFEGLSIKEIAAWGSLISGAVQHGQFVTSLKLFADMLIEGLEPDEGMVLSLLKACDSSGAIKMGSYIHDWIVRRSLKSDILIETILVDMYANCGCIEDAYKVFEDLPNKDVVSWESMIARFAEGGYHGNAFELFDTMQAKGFEPGIVTFLAILKACVPEEGVAKGRVIHDAIIRSGVESNIVIASTLVDMYARYSSLEESCKVFDAMHERDAVSWSTIITGYAMNDHCFKALELFQKMHDSGILPNNATYLFALKACGSTGTVECGQIIHDQIIQDNYLSDVNVGASLIDMYVKCRRLDEAHKVFHALVEHSSVSYGVLIGGYATIGNFTLVDQLLDDMEKGGLRPNESTFTNILAACCRAGMLEKGQQYFHALKEVYGITPSLEHYSCMIDLKGRVGNLAESLAYVKSMPMEPDVVMWKALLTCCKAHGSFQVGRMCFNHLVQLEPTDASVYTLMASLYVDAQMWEDVDTIDEMRRKAGSWKKPGIECIVGTHEAHEFVVSGKAFMDDEEAFMKFERLKWDRFVPQVDLVSAQDIDSPLRCNERPLAGFGYISDIYDCLSMRFVTYWKTLTSSSCGIFTSRGINWIRRGY